MSILVLEENQIFCIVHNAVKKALSELSPSLNQPKTNLKQFLDLKETAEFLNLSPNTIYGLTSSGKLPHIKKTRKLIFDRDILIEWLQNKN